MVHATREVSAVTTLLAVVQLLRLTRSRCRRNSPLKHPIVLPVSGSERIDIKLPASRLSLLIAIEASAIRYPFVPVGRRLPSSPQTLINHINAGIVRIRFRFSQNKANKSYVPKKEMIESRHSQQDRTSVLSNAPFQVQPFFLICIVKRPGFGEAIYRQLGGKDPGHRLLSILNALAEQMVVDIDVPKLSCKLWSLGGE